MLKIGYYMKYFKYLIVILFVLVLGGGTALGHKVNLFAYVDGGKIYTESYFMDGFAWLPLFSTNIEYSKDNPQNDRNSPETRK